MDPTLLNLAGGALGSLVGGIIGGLIAGRQAVLKKWDAETRAEMRNALDDAVGQHVKDCPLRDPVRRAELLKALP